jgi:hypothetical protein
MSSAMGRLRPLGERPEAGSRRNRSAFADTHHERDKTMKYMIMMNTPGSGPYQIASWPTQDLRRHIQFMKDFAERLGAAGELVGAEGLAGPDQAKLVRAGNDGQPITDGIFPEAKEFLAGYWIVDVESPERAYAIAAEASAAPGRDGKPLNLSIEVRQVMSAPPSEG